MSDRPERGLTPAERDRLTERWRSVCSELADLADRDGELEADDPAAQRKAELLAEMDRIATELGRDWLAQKRFLF